MNRHTLKIILAAVGLLVLLGTPFVVAPIFESPTVKSHLVDSWLAECPPGDVRFACNGSQPYYHLMGYVDFGRNIFGIGGDDFNGGSITLTCVPGSTLDVPITSALKPELQRLIAALPSRPMWSWENYNFNTNIYFACWRGGQLRYFVYEKSDLPDEVNDLFSHFPRSSVTELEREAQ